MDDARSTGEARLEEPTEVLHREERRWREQLVRGLLWVVATAAAATWAFGFTVSHLRWATTPFLALALLASCAAVLPRLPFLARASVAVGALLVGAAVGLVVYGTGPNPVVVLATATAMTTMLVGRRAGIHMLVACTLLLGLVFAGHMSGTLARSVDWYRHFDTASAHVAARILVLFVACTGILAFGTSHLVDRAAALLAETTRALFDLRRKEAERAALQRRVELQRASVRRAEEAEVLLRLGGYAAHDFANALTVVTGTLEALRPLAESDAEVREAVEMMDEAIRGAVQTNDELRALSGSKAPLGATILVEEQVTRLGRMLTFVLPDRIRTRVDVRTTGRLRCDATTFQRAIMNLSLNARDAMPEGGELSLVVRAPEVTEPAFEVRAATDFVCVEVQDTGTGITQDDQGRIFEPYFTTKGEAGTGLGLASVREGLRALGGDVWVHSLPEKGATFVTYWPRLDGHAADGDAPQVSAARAAVQS